MVEGSTMHQVVNRDYLPYKPFDHGPGRTHFGEVRHARRCALRPSSHPHNPSETGLGEGKRREGGKQAGEEKQEAKQAAEEARVGCRTIHDTGWEVGGGGSLTSR